MTHQPNEHFNSYKEDWELLWEDEENEMRKNGSWKMCPLWAFG
jgi:hypothetical protein